MSNAIQGLPDTSRFCRVIETSTAALERVEAYFQLALVCYSESDFLKAREYAAQAVGLRRLVFGKGSDEFQEAMALAKKISVELEREQPAKRKRRTKLQT